MTTVKSIYRCPGNRRLPLLTAGQRVDGVVFNLVYVFSAPAQFSALTSRSTRAALSFSWRRNVMMADASVIVMLAISFLANSR